VSYTVFGVFQAVADGAPSRPFVCIPPMPGRDYLPGGAEYTYGETLERALALREVYGAAGFGHGHRVATLLENRPEFYVHWLALNSLGVGIVPINPDYRHDEILYQMDHSEADLAVAVSRRVADLQSVARERARPLPVVDAGAFPTRLPSPGPAPLAGPPGCDTECALLYTSGTTGRPKGCIQTNRYFVTAGQWYVTQGGLMAIAHGQERMYNPLPLFHANAFSISTMAMIVAAGCMIVPDRFHPTRFWDDVVATRATIVHYLGIVAPMLLNQPVSALERRHQVKRGMGAGVEPSLHRRFEERFGFPLVEGWGMTETGRLLFASEEPREIDTRAFGRPRDGFEARVVDDQDREVPRGVEGELCVRFAGPDPRAGFFAGYLKNPEATEEAWRGGWFHTGDTVRQGPDGMLYFVDRKKNIIRRGGENIAAAEIEAVLQAHDDVAQVAVIAVPDELRDEEVMACLVPMPGVASGPELADRLFAWCLERLAYFKAPGFLLFLDALPTTGTQKVQKTQIFPAGQDPRRQSGVLDYRDRKRRPRAG
jgi:crotonobetaine/carnitine-CoA ligase